MIEHKISVPKNGRWNIRGHKLAIVGYSHYWDTEDRVTVTRDVMRMLAGGVRIPFFTRISSYFGLTNDEFWPNVIFFNFVPNKIGTKSDKYATASEEQHEEGRARVLKVLKQYPVDRVLVFSKKAWENFPDTDGTCVSLSDESRHRTEFGTYTIKGRRILAGGFRHPERAQSESMRLAVERFMKLEQP